MLRISSVVLLVLALLLTGCVQPTPTPEAAATDSSGYPAVAPSVTAPAAYPAVEEPTATPGDYPAPSSRHVAPQQLSAARPIVR